ncbi:MAG TPA: tRNA (adenosine(37)-N6)-dimethylallyltransferase MiaA [Syntrophorhabdus aromaticivorans]|nr:tRNA (adenosine(37)-N6)-dimethylallyltransferase MiaA [Syntrophorhabdus aromaticivorans]
MVYCIAPVLSNINKLLAIVGPTCTGKSQLSVDLSLEFGGEVVNADSMQVYKHFDIGTAKPERDAQAGVPHHLLDIIEPHEEFNAAMFKDWADRAINAIWSRNNLPIIVGGTGLYVRALIYGLFAIDEKISVREELKKLYHNDPRGFYENLRAIDPEYAMRINCRDERRMVRAMEVYQLTGLTMSEWRKKHGFREPRYEVLTIGLRKARSELYAKIDARVEEMLQRGWIEEVRSLVRAGYDERLKPFTGIGYREILRYLRGSISYEDMTDEIKKLTRRYAKRQFTWFLKEEGTAWYEYPDDLDSIRQKVAGFLS